MVVGLQAYWSREFAEFVPTWRKAPPRSAPGRSWGSLLPKSAFDPSEAFLLLSHWWLCWPCWRGTLGNGVAASVPRGVLPLTKTHPFALPRYGCSGARVYSWPAGVPLRLSVLQMISPSRQKLGHQRCPDKYWFIYTFFFFLIKSLRKWSLCSKNSASHHESFEEHCERVINLKSFLKEVCVYTAYVCHNLFALCQIIPSCEWNCKYITTHLLEITSMRHSCLILQLSCKTCYPQVL